MRLTLVHWKPAEAGPLIERLRGAGHEVRHDGADGGVVYKAIRTWLPDVVVIDLSRLPSHGREIATALRGAKRTRQIPIVFVGGAPAKVETVRKDLPDAIYASPETVVRAVARVKPPASPVAPPQMMERYAGRSVAQKLGIRPDTAIAVMNPPRDYASAIGSLPDGAAYREDPREPCNVTLWFFEDPDSFRAALKRMRALADRTKLWVLWPKKSARPDSGLTGTMIREAAGAVGLVDYKVCAVDKTWSAFALARRKDRSQRATA
jgi:CheY-like chemotaxis protein